MNNMKTIPLYPSETNYCTLEDVKSAPSGEQCINHTKFISKRDGFDLKKADEFGKVLWETDDIAKV